MLLPGSGSEGKRFEFFFLGNRWLAVRWGMEGQDDRGDSVEGEGQNRTSVLKPAHTFLEGTLREGFVGKLPAELTCMQA